MSEGCTSGAKIIGNRYYLLKNRDLIWGGFRDTIVFENDVFFVTGIDVKDGEFSGASFGFNRYGLAVCNTTVLVTKNNPDDILLEKILRTTKTIEDAFDLVREEHDNGELYHWCNFILASSDAVGVIEIGEGVAELEQDPQMITRSNHHLLLPTSDAVRNARQKFRGAAGTFSGSQKRRQDATKMLSEATSMIDMTQILRSHQEGRSYDSICRHMPQDRKSNPYHGETVYSYILEIIEKEASILEFRLSVTPGNPCLGTYTELEIDFTSPESKYNVISKYP